MRLAEPRSAVRIEIFIKCYAPDDVMGHKVWDDISEEYQRIITDMGSMPCGAGGVPGEWCYKRNCVWCEHEIEEDWE